MHDSWAIFDAWQGPHCNQQLNSAWILLSTLKNVHQHHVKSHILTTTQLVWEDGVPNFFPSCTLSISIFLQTIFLSLEPYREGVRCLSLPSLLFVVRVMICVLISCKRTEELVLSFLHSPRSCNSLTIKSVLLYLGLAESFWVMTQCSVLIRQKQCII